MLFPERCQLSSMRLVDLSLLRLLGSNYPLHLCDLRT
jgi:hypothetical protein